MGNPMNYPEQAAGYRLLFWPVIPCLTRNPVGPSGYRRLPRTLIRGPPV
jgi:hypothetical protein